VSPLAQVGGKAQRHIDQQGGPDLPAEGVGAIAQKPGQTQRLLYLFEEHLDLPAGLVEIAHVSCSPLFIVRIEWSELGSRKLPGGDARPGGSNEDHDALLFVLFHPCLHPPQGPAVELFGQALRPFEPDDFILADAAAGRHRQPAHHAVLKVVLGSRDPGDAPDVERLQLVKIHLRLVEKPPPSPLSSPEQTSWARLLSCSPAVSTMAQAGRELPVSGRRCSLAAALTQSPPHGSLALRATRSSPSVSAAPAASTAPAVLRPVHAVGHQFHHGRIHRVHLHLEAVQQAAALALAAESRLTAVQMSQGAPELALHEIGGAPLVGMGQRVACRGRDPKPGDRPAFEPQLVADIIEAEGVRQLHEHHRRKMAPDGVAAGLGLVDIGLNFEIEGT
jgi:hypothetical protein